MLSEDVEPIGAATSPVVVFDGSAVPEALSSTTELEVPSIGVPGALLSTIELESPGSVEASEDAEEELPRSRELCPVAVSRSAGEAVLSPVVTG